MKILQIGLGGFGKNHLRAWNQLGLGKDLYIAELRAEAHVECQKYNLPSDRISTDYHDFLDKVDIVDVVTPSDTHHALCKDALLHGKDVFVEKPMTMNSEEAVELANIVERTGRILQIGYYYRFHPISKFIKQNIDSGEMGDLRYLSGNFMGFKRARTDVGVTHTDGIHFIDLFNWFLNEIPKEVYAVTRDHFRRGLEDTSIVLFTYNNDVLVKVESGYIQPGRWNDKVVPNAMTTKEIAVMGSQTTMEADFEIEKLQVYDVHHELIDGIWTAINNGGTSPNIGTASPIDQICLEFQAFLNSVETREKPLANVIDSGVYLAKIMEAVYKSAQIDRSVPIKYVDDADD